VPLEEILFEKYLLKIAVHSKIFAITILNEKYISTVSLTKRKKKNTPENTTYIKIENRTFTFAHHKTCHLFFANDQKSYFSHTCVIL
jgi:hypothetical protein